MNRLLEIIDACAQFGCNGMDEFDLWLDVRPRLQKLVFYPLYICILAVFIVPFAIVFSPVWIPFGIVNVRKERKKWVALRLQHERFDKEEEEYRRQLAEEELADQQETDA